MIDYITFYLKTIAWGTIKDIVVTLSALVGAALGIYNFYQLRRSKKIKLEIAANYGQSIQKVFFDGAALPFGGIVHIEIVNVHNRPTYVNQIYLKVPLKNMIFKLPESELKEISGDSTCEEKTFKISNRELKGNERRYFEIHLASIIDFIETLKTLKFKNFWVKMIKICVQTKTGEIFEKRLEKLLKEELLKLVLAP